MFYNIYFGVFESGYPVFLFFFLYFIYGSFPSETIMTVSCFKAAWTPTGHEVWGEMMAVPLWFSDLCIFVVFHTIWMHRSYICLDFFRIWLHTYPKEPADVQNVICPFWATAAHTLWGKFPSRCCLCTSVHCSWFQGWGRAPPLTWCK